MATNFGGLGPMTDAMTTGSSNVAVWRVWYQNATASTQDIGNDPWGNWIQTAGNNINYTYQGQVVQPALTEADVAELRRSQQERDAAFRVREAERKKARERANALLVENLSPEQQGTLEKSGYFDLTLPNGQRYRIKRGSHNVWALRPDGKEGQRYCAISSKPVPEGDVLLMQKLALETDEQYFLRTANRV